MFFDRQLHALKASLGTFDFKIKLAQAALGRVKLWHFEQVLAEGSSSMIS